MLSLLPFRIVSREDEIEFEQKSELQTFIETSRLIVREEQHKEAKVCLSFLGWESPKPLSLLPGLSWFDVNCAERREVKLSRRKIEQTQKRVHESMHLSSTALCLGSVL
jgi:hypothetical protein